MGSDYYPPFIYGLAWYDNYSVASEYVQNEAKYTTCMACVA